MNLSNLSLSVAKALIRSSTEAGEVRPGQTPEPSRPSITISREVGALGSSVAAALGARLGLEVYDKNIMEKVGEEMRRPAFDLEHLDERGSNWVEETLASFLLPKPVPPPKYQKFLLATIRGIGAMGGAVIVGRGANYVLSPATTLRVRLIGDLIDRVKWMMTRNNLSESEARALITRTERERSDFIRQTFGADVTDPHQYDLILNVSRLSVDECADLITAQYRQLEARTGTVARGASVAAATT